MNKRDHLLLISALAAAVTCDPAMAQGTGPSPYGSELGQHTTAPGSKGDRELSAKQQAHPPGKKPHRQAGAFNGASAPRAHPSDDTGAQ
ncbi:MAG: hypothetical protein V4793_03560 [Paraburkholderia tropica]